MHGRRLAVWRGVSDVDHGDHFIPVGVREEVAQQGGVEGADPKGGEAFVFGGEHQVGGDDGGIGLGAVLAVVTTDPGIGRTAAHDQDQRGAIVGPGNALDGLQRIRIGEGPDMDRLLVHRRRRNPTGFQDPVHDFLLRVTRSKRTAGVSSVQYFIEFHRQSMSIEGYPPPPAVPMDHLCTPAAPCHFPGSAGNAIGRRGC